MALGTDLCPVLPAPKKKASDKQGRTYERIATHASHYIGSERNNIRNQKWILLCRVVFRFQVTKKHKKARDKKNFGRFFRASAAIDESVTEAPVGCNISGLLMYSFSFYMFG